MTGSLVIASLPSIGKHNHQISTLSGIEGNFTLSTFDSFINIYKTSHHLASEAEKAFDIIQLYCGQEGINEFNKCLAEIPRFPGFKSFKHGLGNIETFMDSELVNFQFISLFTTVVDTGMKYPKLHNWCYHIIDIVKEYGAINSFTAETYESLHRFCVKIPYRISNH
ncbi:12637_t:CDS:2 [Entrophospora sp. SA101]|nr:12637_t:CDS:2 [Entrophospora sp. SA101]